MFWDSSSYRWHKVDIPKKKKKKKYKLRAQLLICIPSRRNNKAWEYSCVFRFECRLIRLEINVWQSALKTDIWNFYHLGQSLIIQFYLLSYLKYLIELHTSSFIWQSVLYRNIVIFVNIFIFLTYRVTYIPCLICSCRCYGLPCSIDTSMHVSNTFVLHFSNIIFCHVFNV